MRRHLDARAGETVKPGDPALGRVTARVLASNEDALRAGARVAQRLGYRTVLAPEALRETQRLLRTGTQDEILERMRLESQVFAERLVSPEAKVGWALHRLLPVAVSDRLGRVGVGPDWLAAK